MFVLKKEPGFVIMKPRVRSVSAMRLMQVHSNILKKLLSISSRHAIPVLVKGSVHSAHTCISNFGTRMSEMHRPFYWYGMKRKNCSTGVRWYDTALHVLATKCKEGAVCKRGTACVHRQSFANFTEEVY